MFDIEIFDSRDPSVGGTDSAWGLSNLRGGVFDKYEKIDLAILAFGMNDVKRDADSYASNMRRMANGLKTKYEGIEIIFVAPMLPNPDAVGFYGNQPGFRYALLENEAEGVVVADITTLHEDMLKVKSYADMTGNNVNHNNDFLGRVYAHALLETLKVSEYGEDIIGGDSSSESTVESSTVENSSSTADNSEGVESSVVKSSCKASAGAGGMAIILACGMLAIIRKKN